MGGMIQHALRGSDGLVRDLEQLCPNGVLRDVPLARISRWQIGGPADIILRPGHVDELSRLRKWMSERGLPHVVIGATTNLLFADQGLTVPCVQIGPRLGRLSLENKTVNVEAGVWVPSFARRVMQAGLTGAEHVSGIPGTLGGLICMNGGSQRRGIGDNIVSVISVDARGDLVARKTSDCGFAYRRSIFQDNDEIVVQATLHFPEHDNPPAIRTRMLAILRERRRKFPQKLPNCGSVFVSDPAMYAEYGPPGAIIERLGMKGLTVGGAQISPMHANFIVNTGSATARDVLQLVAHVRDTVRERTGYAMRAEGKFVRSDGRILSLCQTQTTDMSA